jgi:hypothetical protein
MTRITDCLWANLTEVLLLMSRMVDRHDLMRKTMRDRMAEIHLHCCAVAIKSMRASVSSPLAKHTGLGQTPQGALKRFGVWKVMTMGDSISLVELQFLMKGLVDLLYEWEELRSRPLLDKHDAERMRTMGAEISRVTKLLNQYVKG